MTENAYLVGVRLAGKKVVIVGGGTVAQRRLGLLVSTGADVHVIARAATPAVESMAGITLELLDYRDGDLADAWYAIAATDDPDVNAAVVAEADRRQIFCVRADIAREGSAVTPATFDYEGLSVGVLAGGEHRRSAAIRTAIHEALQQGLIAADVPLDATGGAAKGTVALVGGGPGDPELITVRGRRLLAHADVVVADRLAPPELLAELPPYVEVIDGLLSKEVSSFSGEYFTINEAVVKPRPVQKPRPPIVIAALGPVMVRFAARMADTWNTMSFAGTFDEQLTEIGAKVDVFNEACAKLGRDPGDVRLSYLMFDPKARSSGGAFSYYASVDAFEVMAGRVMEAGFSELGLYYPVLPEQVSVFERIAQDVLPKIRQAG